MWRSVPGNPNGQRLNGGLNTSAHVVAGAHASVSAMLALLFQISSRQPGTRVAHRSRHLNMNMRPVNHACCPGPTTELLIVLVR